MIRENKHELYKDIWGILTHKNCHPYQINGIENHLHILTYIHPSTALADLVKDIKLGSSSFIKEKKKKGYFYYLMVGKQGTVHLPIRLTARKI